MAYSERAVIYRQIEQGTGAAPSFAVGTAVPDSLIEVMKNNPIPLEPVLKVEGQRTIKFAQPETVGDKEQGQI